MPETKLTSATAPWITRMLYLPRFVRPLLLAFGSSYIGNQRAKPTIGLPALSVLTPFPSPFDRFNAYPSPLSCQPPLLPYPPFSYPHQILTPFTQKQHDTDIQKRGNSSAKCARAGYPRYLVGLLLPFPSTLITFPSSSTHHQPTVPLFARSFGLDAT